MSDVRDRHYILESFRNEPEVAARAVELFDEHQGKILSLWVDVAFQRIPGTRDKSRAEVADHFSKLLEGIVDTLKRTSLDAVPDNPDELDVIGSASAMHGRERATLEGYTLDQLAHEYVILRHVIRDFCVKHDLAEPQVLEVVARVIEYSSLKAVQAFSDSMQEIQRKLVGTLVHDVRTPLSVAYTYAELIPLLEENRIPKQQIADTIIRNLKRSASMLEDVLDATRLEAGQGLHMRFAEVDLNGVLADVCTEARHIYSSCIEAALEKQPVVGVFDSALVVRTLENLISNAVKFGTKGAPIRISLQDCGDRVRVCVHNSGDPIPPEDILSIFDFFSSPGSRYPAAEKGWGLGLSLIRTVARSHGGDVILQSNAESGTTFGMVLCKAYRHEGEKLSVLL